MPGGTTGPSTSFEVRHLLEPDDLSDDELSGIFAAADAHRAGQPLRTPRART